MGGALGIPEVMSVQCVGRGIGLGRPPRFVGSRFFDAVLKIDFCPAGVAGVKMDVATSVYQLALKDIADMRRGLMQQQKTLRPATTLEEYSLFVRKEIGRELKKSCVRKRAEVARLVLAVPQEPSELLIARKEYRLLLARLRAYKELTEAGQV